MKNRKKPKRKTHKKTRSIRKKILKKSRVKHHTRYISKRKSRKKIPKKSRVKHRTRYISKRKSRKKSRVKHHTRYISKRKISKRRKKTAAAEQPANIAPKILSLGTKGWNEPKFKVWTKGSTDKNLYYYPCCTGLDMKFKSGSFKAVFYLKAPIGNYNGIDYNNTEPVKDLPKFFTDIGVRLKPEVRINEVFANYVIVMPKGISFDVMKQNQRNKDINNKLIKDYIKYDPNEFIDEMKLSYFFGEHDIGLKVKLISTNGGTDYKEWGRFSTEEVLQTTSSSVVLGKRTRTDEPTLEFENELYFGVVEIGSFDITSQKFNEVALRNICSKLANLLREIDEKYYRYIYLDIKSENMCTKVDIDDIDENTQLYLVDFDTKFCKPILTEGYDQYGLADKLRDIMIIGYLIYEMLLIYNQLIIDRDVPDGRERLRRMLITFGTTIDKYINKEVGKGFIEFTLFDNVPIQVAKMAAERWKHYSMGIFNIVDPIEDTAKYEECAYNKKIYNYKILELLAIVLFQIETTVYSQNENNVFRQIVRREINIVNSEYDNYIDEKFKL